MKCRSKRPSWRFALATALAALGVHSTSGAADIDIYAATGSGEAPNVLFYLDNTSNWSAQAQGWVPMDSWNKCSSLSDAGKAACQTAIEKVFYVGDAASQKRPWQQGYNSNYWNRNKLPQGVAELRALKLVLQALVCNVADNPATAALEKPLNVNVGLALFTPVKGSALSSGDAVAIIHHAVKPLTKTGTVDTCAQLLGKLDTIDAKINDPDYKAPSDANYGAAFYEVFKYFGGYTNPTLIQGTTSKAGSPVGATGYGPLRFSKTNNVLDDRDAFLSGDSRTTYRSPIGDNGQCGNNYLVLIGNTYPNNEPQSGPPRFGGLNYTPTQLSLLTSDTTKFGDEWSYFLANTDVNGADGIQRVFTYSVNVYNDKPDPSQTKLLQSIAAVGGVGASAYIEVGGDLYALVKAFEGMLLEMAAIDSVFTATTLPVSTTTQGTFLNQVFVGMFRPDAQFSPRWVGNVKQYQLGLVGTSLELLDATEPTPQAAVSSGYFSPLAKSFWTTDSVFFTNLPSGTPASASDSPDGAIVEKGGVAQRLREANLKTATNRNVYTLPAVGASLSSAPFNKSNSAVSTAFATAFGSPTAGEAAIAWVRGEANVVTSGAGMEEFIGAYKDSSGTVTNLGTTGARHSIHGDVLHSRPVAINYGGDDVVVYYGANDGMFRAIDGRKTGSTAGQELWAFIAPEHYPMLKRQREGTPKLQLPETDSSGKPVAAVGDAKPKDYAFDGPIGSYVLYKVGGTAVDEAYIYASMRRGGRSVYAFDVTSKSDPKLLWKIDPTDASDPKSTDYARLGQTWSMAKPIVYKTSSGKPPVVVVMGGGYDPAEDTNTTSAIAGNRIYFINGRTGALLKAVETAYSVPADVTVVDTTPDDGIPDRAYAVDVRGNVYRIDLPTSGTITDPTAWSSTKAVKIAELGGKVFYAPDVIVTKSYVAVMVGTGDREKPLLTSKIDGTDSKEAFFLIKDTLGSPRANALKRDDLALIAEVDKDTMQPVPTDKVGNDNGCYMTLASNGEKVVNAPTTIAGVTYFGTNRPSPSTSRICRADLGEAYAYKFPLFCKAPTSTVLDRGGLPPSPVAGIVEITVNGKPTKLPFIIGGGKGGSSFNPEEPKPSVTPVRRRQFWYIDNRNR